MPKKKEKPRYRQSALTNYYVCPYKMTLSQQYDIPTTMPMREGLLFEFYVFGMTPRSKKVFDTPEEYESSLVGRKKSTTIEPIKDKAAVVKKLFLGGDPFVHLEFEDKDYVNSGEADYIGDMNYNGVSIECIADLKFVGDLASWRYKTKASEYFQALYYSYILFKSTGKNLPFIYVVVEKDMDSPMIGKKLIRFNEEHFKQLKLDVDFIHHDIIKRPKAEEETCIKGPYNKKCDYLEWCEAGRSLVESSEEIEFDSLVPDFIVKGD